VTADRPFAQVWKLVKRIPRGRVATYGQLSRMIAQRLTPIGIGWAIRAEPEGTIPWQRVVGAEGRIATDREHPGLQREMLESEGVRFLADGHVDMARHAWSPRGASTTERAPRRASPRADRRRR